MTYREKIEVDDRETVVLHAQTVWEQDHIDTGLISTRGNRILRCIARIGFWPKDDQ